jgi:hypothetical protein
MAGCSFETQQPCAAGRACLPAVNQSSDTNLVCTPSYPVVVKLHKVARGSVECWSGKRVSGTKLDTITPIEELWIGCPVGTQSVLNKSGTDSTVDLKFTRPGEGGVNLTISGNNAADVT